MEKVKLVRLGDVLENNPGRGIIFSDAAIEEEIRMLRYTCTKCQALIECIKHQLVYLCKAELVKCDDYEYSVGEICCIWCRTCEKYHSRDLLVMLCANCTPSYITEAADKKSCTEESK